MNALGPEVFYQPFMPSILNAMLHLFRNMNYAKCGKFEQCAVLALKEYYYQPIVVILSGIHVTVYAILG